VQIDKHLNDLHRVDKEKEMAEENKRLKEKGFPVSEPNEYSGSFEILEEERYKLIMYFEQFVHHFQNLPELKTVVEKIYKDKKFSYKDYSDVQSAIKHLRETIENLDTGWCHTVVSHPLAVFFEGIISYERTSRCFQNKAGFFSVPQPPKRSDVRSGNNFHSFIEIFALTKLL
jgi:hypothetical protein